MPADGRGAHDYDWLVIGSGFGGSVSALRLAEKGYRVAVLECGRRFRDEDFGEPGKEVPDPYFGGEGPPRSGCIRCGSCMVGCRHGAKNTLVKNYLWFAERLGVEVIPERYVTDVRPLGAGDGSEGYEVSTQH